MICFLVQVAEKQDHTETNSDSYSIRNNDVVQCVNYTCLLITFITETITALI